MISYLIRYSWAFISLILLQVLILNNLHLSIYINPYVYILFILILPFQTRGWLVLSLAFLLGIIMDAFCNTPGIHSSATVLMAFLRRYFLDLFAPREGYESGMSPHYRDMGMIWFLIYAGVLTIIHHFFLFLLEDFRLSYLLSSLLKAIVSSLFSLILMIILLLVSYRPKR